MTDLGHSLDRWLYRGQRPHRLARALNAAWAGLAGAGLTPKRLVELKVVGRRTGKAVSLPVVIADYEGERYLVSMLGEGTNWVRNVRAAGGRAVLRHGAPEDVLLEEVDPADRPPILKRYLECAPGARSHVPVDRRDPIEKFSGVAPRIPVFRIVSAPRANAGAAPVSGKSAGRAQPGVVARSAEVVTALSMTVGRGAAARLIAQLAGVGPGDQVVDVGCGPGTAAREAARRGATVTGVDPSPVMLALAGRISALRRVHGVSWLEGSAESVPLSDGSATVVWSLSSVHHWRDRAAGVAEARRVLRPGGRLLLAERLTRPGARGHAAHGLTAQEADDLTGDLVAAGFVEVGTSTQRARRCTLVVVRAERPING